MIIDSILTGNTEALVDALRHMVLPAITLSLYSMAIIARMTRSSMLETPESGLYPHCQSQGRTGEKGQ